MKKIMEVGSGKCFRNLRGIVIAGALALVISPSFAAPFIYVGDAFGDMYHVIDTATNAETARISTGDYKRAVVHPSGERLYVPISPGGMRAGLLEVYDTNDNSLLETITVGASPSTVAIHSSGDFVYVGARSEQPGDATSPGIISVVDTSTNTISATIDLAQTTRITDPILVAHPTEDILYVGIRSRQANKVIAYNTNTLQPIGTINVGAIPMRGIFGGFVVHPSAPYLYALIGWSVQVYDTTTNALVDSISLNNHGLLIVIHPNGNTLYVGTMYGGSVSVVDINTNTVASVISGPDFSDSMPILADMAIHPSGDSLYGVGYSVSGIEGFASVIDTASNQVTEVFSIATNEGSPRGLPLSITIGPLLGDPVGGSLMGLSTVSVTCVNATSGQSVLIGLGSDKTWDCESSGLQVNSGDSIEMVVSGSAD
ncbi:MAG: YncE family protein [Gammaproteobacteria bacterium]|nr:YncE family protein [Gammaproteobacteria bacterium]MCF6231056.1 YncE family protein [Gammaproteobacteria bacterium]